ncbi:hypothetical protein ABPG74_019861 [Tetrahymena malaccensis]
MKISVLALIALVSLANVNAQFSGDMGKVVNCLKEPESRLNYEECDENCQNAVEKAETCIQECQQDQTSVKAIGLLIKSKCTFEVKKVQITVERISACYILGEATEDQQGQQDNNNQKDQQNNQNNEKDQDQKNNQDNQKEQNNNQTNQNNNSDKENQNNKDQNNQKDQDQQNNNQETQKDKPNQNEQPAKNDNKDKENQNNNNQNSNNKDENKQTNQNVQKDQNAQAKNLYSNGFYLAFTLASLVLTIFY